MPDLGQNLNWFWKSWFFDGGVPDLAIGHVSVQNDLYTVSISKVGTKPVPIDLMIFYNDGTTQMIHQSISAWKNGNKTYTVTHTSHKKVKKMILGGPHDPDVNKGNNVWQADR